MSIKQLTSSASSNNKDIVEIKELSMSSRNLVTLDLQHINNHCSLECLDLSRNSLRNISGIHLPNLKTLNCEDNAISDVAFLSQFPCLEKLFLTGNPISVADRYVAIDLLPNLKELDGMPCLNVKDVVHNLEERLNFGISEIFKAKYASKFKKCTSSEDVNNCKKQLCREGLGIVSNFTDVPLKFRRHKVQQFIEQFLKNVEATHLSSYLNKIVLSSPVANSKPTSKIVNQPQPNLFDPDLSNCKRSKAHRKIINDDEQDISLHVISPSKRSKKASFPDSSKESELNYEPHIFLRCHSSNNDPQDKETSVWCAEFEPDLTDQYKTTDIVATCGGNLVCFINVLDGHILKRYKTSNEKENLFALSWTILEETKHSQQKSTVLVTGGAGRTIYLIHPSQLVCFHSFKAHTNDINCLQFHPADQHLLFSGSSDNFIHVWKIELILPNYKSSYQKLMTFNAFTPVVQLLISRDYEILFVASNNGLSAWSLQGKHEKWPKHAVTLKIPEHCVDKDRKLADGLAFISSSCLVAKSSNSGKIFLWNFSNWQINSSKSCSHQIQPTYIYSWSNLDLQYNYIGSCIDAKMFACGDGEGQIWMYHLPSCSKERSTSSIPPTQLPAVVLPWPYLKFKHSEFIVKNKVIVNSVKFNCNGGFMVACTDTNLVCIWHRT